MKKSIIERFFKNINKTNFCWIWKAGRCGGNTIPRGEYGVFWNGEKQIYAHRFSYELFNKKTIKKGFQIDHLCNNKLCCNPDHLKEVTCRENILKANSSPAINSRKTHCKRGHEFTPSNIYLTSYGYRQCITCRKLVNDLQCGKLKAQAAAQALGLLSFNK